MSYKNYLAALDADRVVCYYLISVMHKLDIHPPGNLLMEYWFFEKRFNDQH
jgi:hypothetical protein